MSANFVYCAIKAPANATMAFDKPRPKIISESVFAEKLRIMRLLSPVARIAKPTSVFKNQSTINLIMNVTTNISTKIPHVEGTVLIPIVVNTFEKTLSIPRFDQKLPNIENTVSVFNNGIFGRVTPVSEVIPIIRRLMEYSAIIIKIPASNGLIFPFVCKIPVIHPAINPATVATNVANSGL